MMKRLTALALCCALLVCVLAVPSAATSSATITVGTASGQKGDIVELPVTISANSYLVNADLLIEFDATCLELVDDYYDEGCCQTASMFSSRWTCIGVKESESKLWYFIATGNNTGLTAGGEMFRMAFRILKDDVESVAVTVRADVICGNDGTGAPDESGYPADYEMSCAAIAGAVKIGTAATTAPDEKLVGDLNFDNRISMKDALMLYAGVSGNGLTQERLAVADITGDGAVNMRDALKLYALVSGVHA